MEKKSRLGALLACGALVAALVFSCSKGSGYEVRFDAVRATGDLREPIGISLWLYPIDAKDELFHYFDESKIGGAEWVELAGSGFVEIPERLLTDASYFVFRVELNPNRFLTPADAVFEASAPLDELVSKSENGVASLTVRATSNAPFEVRLQFRRSNAE